MRRTALCGLVVLTATFVFNLAAVNAEQAGYPLYPWCAQYSAGAGGLNCYFSTLSQCQQAASGNGGYCAANRFYADYGSWYSFGRPAPRRSASPY